MMLSCLLTSEAWLEEKKQAEAWQKEKKRAEERLAEKKKRAEERLNQQIIELRQTGMTAGAIGRKLGIPGVHVRGRIRRLVSTKRLPRVRNGFFDRG